MRVYLDVCCLNRPFDDQTQDRVRLETEALLGILSGFQSGAWTWLGSGAIVLEINEASDEDRRAKLRILAGQAHQQAPLDFSRARELVLLGFPPLDALHLASAEAGGADVFLTTDDRLLRLASRLSNRLRVSVANLQTWWEAQNAG